MARRETHSIVAFLAAIVPAIIFSGDALKAQNRPLGRDRTAWQYVATSKDKSTLVIRRSDDSKWFVKRPDGTRSDYLEVSRNNEEIIIQNVKTKLLHRLTEGRGYWRLHKETEINWRKWAIGKWVSQPVPVTPQPAASNSGSNVLSPRRIKLAYFVPSDRKPAENYRRKIGVIMEIVAEIFRDDLRRKRYKTDGFKIESDDAGAIVRLIRGQKTAAYYNNAPQYDDIEQWSRVIPVVREQLGPKENQVVVVFSETYDNGPAKHGWPGGIARGAYYTADGGAALYSAHLLKDEFCGLTLDEQRQKLFDNTPVPGRKAFGQPMNTLRGRFAEHGIGAAAHELGHAFGLPHDFRRDDQSIMGNGFRNLRRNFSPSSSRRVGFSNENAALLMSSRYLNPELDRADNTPPTVELKLIVEPPRSLFASVSATDDTGLRTAVFSDMVAGTIVGGQKLKGSFQNFKMRIPQAKLKDGNIEVRVIVTDDGGNQTRVEQLLKVQ